MLSSLILGMFFQPVEASPPTPQGSYRLTCHSISVGPHRLRAVCGTIDGGYRNTAIRGWRSCSGEIVNRDGHLVCEVPRPAAYPQGSYELTPQGSYELTCVDVSMSGPSLQATCKTRDGHWLKSRLPRARDCRGEIANIDGYLTCMR